MRRDLEREYERLSPFEIKNTLIELASAWARSGARDLLNAGRGNPNWVATTPREAFFTLGTFALEESRRSFAQEKHMGGPVTATGIAQRLGQFLAQRPGDGVAFLRRALEQGQKLGFEPDAFVHELTQGVIGDHYPSPDRMLPHAEKVAHAYLMQEMCAGDPPAGRYDLFATEGGTAAMCYLFYSLVANRLLHPGDTIAIGVPIFTPYLEIPQLNDYHFKVVPIEAKGENGWQYDDKEIDKLADPEIKAFFLVNPSNPPSVAMRPSTLKRLRRLVLTRRPDLIILTDDVYGTFVEGFVSLMAILPRNTLTVYSYSKYFGCTGWRLGVIALHQDNVLDERIAALPAEEHALLEHRYGSLSTEPSKMKFIDRLVADSRQVALNHTAGLSLPQQVQMTLFSLFSLGPDAAGYKRAAQGIVRRRLQSLWDGMGLPLAPDPLRAGYYSTLDLLRWAERQHGADFVNFLITNYEPVDIVFRLAERFGTVLLNGGGFEAPEWSARVSLANLPDKAYAEIGQHLAEVAKEYVAEWKASRGDPQKR